MASIADVGLFGQISNKRPLENGFVPRYKPRKVSAVRDFPRGCGFHAAPADFKNVGNGIIGADVSVSVGVDGCNATHTVVANGVESSFAPSLMEADRVDGMENSETVKDEGHRGVEVSNVEVDCVSPCIDKSLTISVDVLVEDVMAAALDGMDTEEVLVEIGPRCDELPNEVEVQTLEAFDQPIELDRSESLDALVGKTNTVDGFLNSVAEVTDSDFPKEETEPEGQTAFEKLGEVAASVSVLNYVAGETKSVSDAGASIDELLLVGVPQPSTSFHGSFELGASTMVKDKYRPRKMSAIRDFPPDCGTEQNQQTLASGKEYLDGVKNVGMELEGMNETYVTEKRASVARELGSFEECRGGAQYRNIEETKARQSTVLSGTSAEPETVLGREHSTSVMKKTVVSSLTRSAAVRPLHNGFDSDDKLHRLIVHGLAAAPFCPWMKGKQSSIDLLSGSTAEKSKKHSFPRKRNSKAASSNRILEADYLGNSSTKKTAVPGSYDTDGNQGSSMIFHKEDQDVYDEDLPYLTPIPIRAIPGDVGEDTAGPDGKEIIVYEPDMCESMKSFHYGFSLKDEVEREVVHRLMTAPYCPRMQGKIVLENSDVGNRRGKKLRNRKLSLKKKVKAIAKKSNSELNFQRRLSNKPKEEKEDSTDDEDGSPNGFMQTDEVDPDHHGNLPVNSSAMRQMQDIGVSLPPFGPNYSSQGDARNRVRETLRLFHAICRKLLQKEEANLKPDDEGNSREFDKKMKRIDLVSAKIIKHKGKEVNTDKQMFGQLPGVEVGDEFQYRVELAIVGIHRLYQAGIDWMKVDGEPVAISIVASGAYSDDLENSDVLIYSGQGGNNVGKNKQPEDQKLERGNLALRNSISAETPVRVVRGWKEIKTIDPTDSRPKMISIYVYDGLYTVKRYWTEVGPRGKQVFMFELRRNPGQPELAWKELKNSNKSRTRPGVCVSDISGGKELFPIFAFNIIDDEKPPPFNYTPKMIYPDWFCPIPPKGCNCTGRCSDTKKCPCTMRNGGEIPYNRNGAIVEAKPLVFECGPSCNCPPSCYNRVTQRGIRFKLEIFKTDSRGWGIRSLNSIPSGSFICEYAGELLEEKEAEQRVGNDEYLFDIGQNYSDFSLHVEEQAVPVESMEEAEAGYTIDAGQYGNVGRFVNHSCSPNLYAQNVIYDHDDKRMPHVMLFAAENIPPLQELTYHYNYTVDQVLDSNGNIKIKKCYCGSAECTGRMY